MLSGRPSPRPWPLAAGLAVLSPAAVSGLACTHIPPGRVAIDAVAVEGNRVVSADALLARLATTPTSRFLGLFRGVMFDYELLDEAVVARDLARIERFLRARGYYDAHARVARITPAGEGHARVTFDVEEGAAVRVATVDVTFPADDAAPAGVRSVVQDVVRAALPVGASFDETAFDDARARALAALGDGGHPAAVVARRADVDVGRHAATVAFEVTSGPRAFFGDVTIEGLGELPEQPVRMALGLARGDTYSAKRLTAAQERALELGVFDSVEITPDLDALETTPAVPLRVRVEPTRLRRLRLGGGIVLDSVKTDAHAVVTWDDRNCLGGLRHVTVEERPGVVLYPTRLPDLLPPERLLPSNRITAQLRRPAFLEARTVGRLKVSNDAYPVMLKTGAPTGEGEPVLGYVDTKGAVGVERLFGSHVFVGLSHTVQLAVPFAYVGPLDPKLTTVVISYPTLTVQLDGRDSPLDPTKGYYLGLDLQAAGLGGDAHDVKMQPEARGYVRLAKGLTLAGRVALGFVVPFDYALGNVTEGTAEAVRESQILYFRGLFSGGPNSNRGYPLRGVGPRGDLSFYNSTLASGQVFLDCNSAEVKSNPEEQARCSVPLGGLTLWEASIELRVEIAGPLRVAGFCDASDVSSKAWDVRLDHPHLSCGAGVRYDTPVGPLRVDAGVRIPGAQAFNDLDPVEQAAAGTIGGVPMAIQFGIGEAY
jgi:outer membrane protein insertion porin family/translocation and assembly module TamA